ncbi:MAG: hypothetical protein A07HR60_02335 [uncultured archaeon A07HR60]|nr:MAG: hypothetical protein A07HR60_02335 [uncultured archaeon A07HR60]
MNGETQEWGKKVVATTANTRLVMVTSWRDGVCLLVIINK